MKPVIPGMFRQFRSHFVIPAHAGIQSYNGSPPATQYSTGCRVKPGMTGQQQAPQATQYSIGCRVKPGMTRKQQAPQAYNIMTRKQQAPEAHIIRRKR